MADSNQKLPVAAGGLNIWPSVRVEPAETDPSRPLDPQRRPAAAGGFVSTFQRHNKRGVLTNTGDWWSGTSFHMGILPYQHATDLG